MGLKSAKRSGIQAQTTLIPVFVTTLETRLLKSTISTDCLYKYRNMVRLFFTSYKVQRELSGTCILFSFFFLFFVKSHLFWCMLMPFCVRESLLALNKRLSSLRVAIVIMKASSRSFSTVQWRAILATNFFISVLKSSTSATRDDTDTL